MQEKNKIEKAVDYAMSYGGIDGSHHKTWVIDQMVRTLLEPEEYQQFIKNYRGELKDGVYEYDEWDVGIAP